MSTRSLTVFIDCMFDKEEEVAVLYRQSDGYPTCHGAILKEFFTKARITNGYSSQKLPYKQLNGMGSAACSLIASLVNEDHRRKEENNKRWKSGFDIERHQFHLHQAGTRDCGEEYIYTLKHNTEGEILLEVECCGVEMIYQGKMADFDPAKVEEIANKID